MKRVLILANSDLVVYNFRLELVERLVNDGNQVIIACPYGERIDLLVDIGCQYIKTEVSRHGKNPFKDLKLLSAYKKTLKELKPDIVFAFTVKPNVYGGMACKKYKIPFVANVTGLGDAVENGGLLQKITLFLYKLGLKKAKCVFFQNESNLDFFTKKKIVRDNAVLLPGSGVNLQRFTLEDYPQTETTNLVFVGRVIKDKGVNELANVFKKLLCREDIRLTVVGDVEFGTTNPFENLPNVTCAGFNKDVRPFLKDAHAIVLPSYHEGMANVLLEASATGRAVLASNVSGCIETFDEGVSGFGFEAKDEQSLKDAIIRFADLTLEEKRQMGLAGRKKVEEQFDRRIVVGKYLEQIESLRQ
ncbi:MAG: glycosyltransferase family 4 protein [Clostridia bacterium]|nr:glycosyltransferase family 4 protein [Clostridia bacterium]